MKIQEDIADVKQQLWEIQRKNEKISSGLEELSVSMGDEISSDINSFKKYHTNTQLALEALKMDIQILGEKINDTNFRLSSLADQIVSRRALSETRNPYYPSGESEFNGSTADLRMGDSDQVIPEVLFDQARQDCLNGNYKLALEGFREYLQRFPTSEFADDGQYWIAHCYYNQDNFTQALKEYDKVIQNYSKSEKVKSAYLKKGLCHFELNQIAKGVVQLQRLLEKYPDSDEASIAKERLENMGLKGQ